MVNEGSLCDGAIRPLLLVMWSRSLVFIWNLYLHVSSVLHFDLWDFKGPPVKLFHQRIWKSVYRNPLSDLGQAISHCLPIWNNQISCFTKLVLCFEHFIVSHRDFTDVAAGWSSAFWFTAGKQYAHTMENTSKNFMGGTFNLCSVIHFNSAKYIVQCTSLWSSARVNVFSQFITDTFSSQFIMRTQKIILIIPPFPSQDYDQAFLNWFSLSWFFVTHYHHWRFSQKDRHDQYCCSRISLLEYVG